MDPLAFVAPLVAHVDGHRRLFRALAGKRSAHHVKRRMLSVISSLLDERTGLGAREVERLLRQLTSALLRETEKAVQ